MTTATARGIHCGSCKQYHETIAEVRACSTRRHGTADSAADHRRNLASLADGQAAADEIERRFDVLIQDRERREDEAAARAKLDAEDWLNEATGGEWDTRAEDVLWANARQATLAREEGAAQRRWDAARTRTPAQPRAKREPLPKVDDGRYAIEEDGELHFFKVKNGSGKWAGWIFIDIQASDDLHAIRDINRKRAILTEIAKDQEGALRRYGREIGECGRCGRTLTSEWRLEGIGPVCVTKV